MEGSNRRTFSYIGSSSGQKYKQQTDCGLPIFLLIFIYSSGSANFKPCSSVHFDINSATFTS